MFCHADAGKVIHEISSQLVRVSVTFKAFPLHHDEADEGLLMSSSNGHTQDSDMDIDMNSTPGEVPNFTKGAKIRLSLTDARKCALRGEIRIESISRSTCDAREETQTKDVQTYVLMRRSKGDPLEWRRLFRTIATSPEVRTLICS